MHEHDLTPELLPENVFEEREESESPPDTPEGFASLVANGLDFLKHAIEELEEQPKYSVIHFCTGIELLLKARLLHEHWSLVVKRPGTITKQQFSAGEFESVSLSECLDRIEKVCGDNLAEERKSFTALASHRNRAIHFFHELYSDTTKAAQLQHIAIEQFRGGALLVRLLREQWKSQFVTFEDSLQDVEHALRGHKQYFEAKLKLVMPQIEKLRASGERIRNCTFCKLPSAIISDNGSPSITEQCLVCEWLHDGIEIKCPECGKGEVEFDAGRGDCDECDTAFGMDFLFAEFGEGEAYCPNCSYSEHSVIPHGDGYLCVACGCLYDRIGRCGWCGEDVAGETSSTYLSGCMFCDGLIGHAKDD